ncbi:MAG: ThuA domain-containing protein [Halanaerobiaceae bacterium]
MKQKIKVTVWNEFRHEKESAHVGEVYPDGIHGAIAQRLGKEEDFVVQTATLDDPEQGLSEKILEETDVLLWWAHKAHGEVKNQHVNRVYNHVMEGMGLIPLHSAHASKIFSKLCGTNTGKLKWRDAGEKERLWVIDPGHPITEGLSEYIELPHTEMYGEHFDIPEPDRLIFISWFAGGEVFRSGCCYKRGKGKIFYFRPGHETFPIYKKKEIITVLKNAVRWARPVENEKFRYGNVDALEDM